MARALICGLLLGLAACGRLGFGEGSLPAADGGGISRADASMPFDAGTPAYFGGSDAPDSPDAASAQPDAASEMDAASAIDASDMPDASSEPDASSMLDAASPDDAASATLDAADTSDAAMADAAPSCTPLASHDYCTTLPALPEAPQLDGVLDCGPPLIDITPSGWNSTQAMPADNKARYAAAWRPDGIYVYVEVDDPVRLPALASDVDPWCGDGVELYADADGKFYSAPDYDDPGTMQFLAAAPAQVAGTALAVDALYHTRSDARAHDWAVSRHVVVPRDNGYALEAFITAADLELSGLSLASGGSVGLDIAINVSIASATSPKVGCGNYMGQYYLRVSRANCNSDNCRPYSNVAAFCTPTLE